MAEPADRRDVDLRPDEMSCDAWLGGRLSLVQPRRGHRAGTDAVLLAAAAGFPQGRFADVGAGAGAVALAILSRSPGAGADLVEIDADLASLAAGNAARNGLAAQTRIFQLDVCDRSVRRAAGLADGEADAVVTNPPFFDPATVRVSPEPARARAYVFGGETGAAPLAAWIRACLAILKSGGRFVMIHRPEALTAIVAAAHNRLGALALLPVHPRAGAPAHRLLVSGVKGSKAPLRLASGLVLHEADGRLTGEADAIHRGQALIEF